MDTFSKIMAILVAIMLLWFLFRYIRSNPESLSLANLNKSFFTMGLLGLILIAFIAAVVFLLRRH